MPKTLDPNGGGGGGSSKAAAQAPSAMVRSSTFARQGGTTSQAIGEAPVCHHMHLP